VHIDEFLMRARGGRVRIVLADGQVRSGRFRTDILSRSALAAFFIGDVGPLTVSIADVVSIESLAPEAAAS
jgi:hypothetical protein